MKFKSLPIAAIFGCYIFGSSAIAQQVCPVGGGTCVTRPGPAPASSYSNARSVDIMIRQPVPVIPTAQSLLPEILPLLPTPAGTITTGSMVVDYVDYNGAAGYVTTSSVRYVCVSGVPQSAGLECPAGSGPVVTQVNSNTSGISGG